MSEHDMESVSGGSTSPVDGSSAEFVVVNGTLQHNVNESDTFVCRQDIPTAAQLLTSKLLRYNSHAFVTIIIITIATTSALSDDDDDDYCYYYYYHYFYYCYNYYFHYHQPSPPLLPLLLGYCYTASLYYYPSLFYFVSYW